MAPLATSRTSACTTPGSNKEPEPRSISAGVTASYEHAVASGFPIASRLGGRPMGADGLPGSSTPMGSYIRVTPR